MRSTWITILKDGSRQSFNAHVIPPVYKIHSEEVPHERASNFIPFRKDVEASDRRGQLAEEQILNAFVDYGYRHAQPMFIFHGFDFKSLDKFGKDRLKLIMNMNFVQQETDLIIVHRDIGIILVETKGGLVVDLRPFKNFLQKRTLLQNKSWIGLKPN